MPAQVALEELYGAYELVEFNEHAKPETHGPVTLVIGKADDGKLAVSCTVANTLNGLIQVHNQDDGTTLKGMLMSTRMMGSPAESAIEGAIFSGFADGFHVQRMGTALKLMTRGSSLTFGIPLKADQIFGEYRIVIVNGEPHPSKPTFSLRFTPGSNPHEPNVLTINGKVVNSLYGQVKVTANRLIGEVSRTSISGDAKAMEIENAIFAGFQAGVTVLGCGTQLTLVAQGIEIVCERALRHDELTGSYELVSINGKVTSHPALEVKFIPGESMVVNVTAHLANTITGAAKLHNNHLSGALHANSENGRDADRQTEHEFIQAIHAGVHVVVTGAHVVLRNKDVKLTLQSKQATVFAHGIPTYEGETVVKCFPNNGNGLLFRIINTPEKTWAFYNDTKLYTMHVTATIGPKSDIKILGKTTMSSGENGKRIVKVSVEPLETAMFLSGVVNGFTFTYDATPLQEVKPLE